LKTQLLPTEPLPQPQPPPAREISPVKQSPLAFVPRLAGYALMAFIAWLLLTTLFEPWFSSSATRAVLNAPAVLITTPISGTVSAQYAQNGQPIQPGQTIAVVKNTTVERDALTTLLTQRLELQSHLDDLRSRLQADQRMLDYTNGQYQKYQQASVSQLQSAYESIQAQQDANSAKLEELDTKYARAMALERDGAISAAAAEEAGAEADAARSEADALDQNADSVNAGIAAAKRGVYVSAGQDSNGQLPQLSQHRADLQNSIKDEEAQADALGNQLANLNQLIDHEQNRVQTLSDYVVKAYSAGTAQEVVAPIGTQVSAGSTLVRATDCSKTDIVAVFPARMSPRLNIGTELRVRLSDNSRARDAHITQLLPKATESMQNGFSAPFPYAEDGSVYALAQWDNNRTNATPATCTPGRSVTASLATNVL
jgi:multidrug efflux pump subunit AcrA (membrane-fusion protein)